MKLIIEFKEATGPYYDNASPYKITLISEEEEKTFSIHEGEPEDMNFGRDLSTVFGIPSLIKEAYKAGKRGEDFEKIEKEYEW